MARRLSPSESVPPLINWLSEDSLPPVITWLSKEEERENRRLHVLTSIIHKKVLSYEKLPIQKREEKLSAVRRLGALNNSKKKHKSKLLSVRRFDVLNFIKRNHKRNDGEGGRNEITNGLKDDLYICNSGSGSSQQSSDSSKVPGEPGETREEGGGDGRKGSSSCNLFAPQTCAICYEDYKKGDDVAWSKNEECHHAYHVDCILEWLMLDHDECPQCRAKFILPIS